MPKPKPGYLGSHALQRSATEHCRILDALIFNPDFLSDAHFSIQYFIVLTSEKQTFHGEQGVA